MKPIDPAACVVRSRARRFSPGRTSVTREGRAGRSVDPLMDFDILRLPRGSRHREVAKKETVWVLLEGRAEVRLEGRRLPVERGSVFEHGPAVIHCGSGSAFEVVSTKATEWAVVRSRNERPLESRVYQPDDCSTEDRGAGLVQGACRRLVRTVFDYATQPESALVVGEVVNFPGRWSTYPPHHHAQPEIYHYRFTLPQGYGHAEVGENVYKVYHGDTVKIPGGLDHAQVSAPGYGMYYLWVIRHLPGLPYRGFEFTRDHRWLLDPQQQGWQPALLAGSSA